MIRLFVAVDLPEDVRNATARLCFGVPGARWVGAENLHLTLRFIGEVDEGAFEDIAAALALVRAPAFPLTLRGVGCFASRRLVRALWVGVDKTEALNHLHGRIESALLRAGLAPEGRKFTPNVTLARLRDAPRHRVDGFLREHGLFRAGPFTVESFALFSSFLSQSGALHRAEAVYPLASPETPG